MARVRSATDKMHLFTPEAANKIAGKYIEVGKAATLSSIYAKLNASDKPLTVEESIKIAKTHKKDTLYGLSMHAIEIDGHYSIYPSAGRIGRPANGCFNLRPDPYN